MFYIKQTQHKIKRIINIALLHRLINPYIIEFFYQIVECFIGMLAEYFKANTATYLLLMLATPINIKKTRNQNILPIS